MSVFTVGGRFAVNDSTNLADPTEAFRSGRITYRGSNPIVFGAAAAPAGPVPAGSSVKGLRKRRKWQATYKGQLLEAKSAQELLGMLQALVDKPQEPEKKPQKRLDIKVIKPFPETRVPLVLTSFMEVYDIEFTRIDEEDDEMGVILALLHALD